ncbi:hypothetical protein QTP88_005556 [Uroleucon formosanum]
MIITNWAQFIGHNSFADVYLFFLRHVCTNKLINLNPQTHSICYDYLYPQCVGCAVVKEHNIFFLGIYFSKFSFYLKLLEIRHAGWCQIQTSPMFLFETRFLDVESKSIYVYICGFVPTKKIKCVLRTSAGAIKKTNRTRHNNKTRKNRATKLFSYRKTNALSTYCSVWWFKIYFILRFQYFVYADMHIFLFCVAPKLIINMSISSRNEFYIVLGAWVNCFLC